MHVDAAAIAWAIGIVAAAALLLGLAPAFRIPFERVHDALKESGRSQAAGTGQSRVCATLVVVETALACMLLVGAGLLLRSFLRVLDVDPGFDPSRAVAFRVDYDDKATQRGAERSCRRCSTTSRAFPVSRPPASPTSSPLDRNRSWSLRAKGRDTRIRKRRRDHPNRDPRVHRRDGRSAGSGRDFTWDDTPSQEPVIIINEAAARYDWPGDDPIGKLALGIGEGEARSSA